MTLARWMDLALALAAGGALAWASWLVPTEEGLATPGGGTPPPACWLREASGVECPTCGMTRSYVALVHGDLEASVRWHPAGPLLVLGSVALLVAAFYFGLRRRRPLWSRSGFHRLLSGIAVAALVAGIARYVTGS